MGSKFPLITLDMIAEVIDSRHKTPNYTESGYPMVRVVDIKGGELDLKDTKRVTKDIYEDFSKGRSPQTGDLVISRVGSYGNISYVSGDDKFCLGQNTAFIIPNEKNNYLYYALISPFVQQQIEDMAVGAVQKTISLKSIKNLNIPFPHVDIRNAISKIMRNIDTRISINNKINIQLEQMSQTLFKSWFVDFDPVIDNALDAGNPIPEALQSRAELRQKVRNSADFKPLPADIRALFPAEFEETELGCAPHGWVTNRLENILELAYGKALKKTERTKGDYPVYGSGGVDGTHNEYLVKGPGIIVGRKGTVGSLHWENKDFYPIDTVFFVKPKEYFSLVYCYQLLKTLGLENMNTDAAVPGLNRNNAYRLEVITPTQPTVAKFTNIIQAIHYKMDSNHNEAETLTNLRDTLLPKLISGELSLEDLPNLVAQTEPA